MTFPTVQNYVVVAVTDPQYWTLTDALARSLEIQVLDDDDQDGWGSHGRHRGDHGFTDGLTSSIPQASASATASLDMGDGNNDSDHRGSRSSNHLNTAVIVGLIFGVSAFWVLLGLLVYCLIRRRDASHSTERQRDDKNITPFDLRTSHPFNDNITNLDQEALLSRGKRTWREAMALGRHPYRSPSNGTTRTIYADSGSRFFVGQPNRLPAENTPHSHTSHGSSAQVMRAGATIAADRAYLLTDALAPD
ncbi:hypothetical protein BDZ89DRAFT_574179 [Hymenopellis radicata]|nr:hypothetical protein BDZ89DRAFT_574179 [Hymenopellis radicata]